MSEHRRSRKWPLLITLQPDGHFFAAACGSRFVAGLTADEALGTVAQWIYTSKLPGWMIDRTPSFDRTPPGGA